jgi:hypothetical protein
MADNIRIVSIERDGEDGLIVKFSDGTVGAYVAEELLELRPVREQVEKPKGQPPPQKQQRDLNKEWLLTETIRLSAVPKSGNGRIH